MNINHYLISINAGPVDMHGYLMCPRAEGQVLLTEACNRMFEAAEKANMSIPLPIMLSTDLGDKIDSDIEMIRDILRMGSPPKPVFEDAQTYHFTCWVMRANDPLNKKLMELH